MEELKDETQSPSAEDTAATTSPAPESIQSDSANSSTPSETPETTAASSGGDASTADSTAPKKDPGGPQAPHPRTMAEIERSYDELRSGIGQAYIEREYHDGNLRMMMAQYAQLSREAGARKQIDDKLAESAKSKAEAKRARKAKRDAAVASGMSPADADALANQEEFAGSLGEAGTANTPASPDANVPAEGAPAAVDAPKAE